MKSGAPDGIAENLRFLLLEGKNQLARTRDFLTAPTEELARAIKAREPYVHNLRRAIQRKAFAPRRPARDALEARRIRAAELVAGAIEEIGAACVGIVEQVGYLQEDEALFLVEFGPYFEPLLEAFGRLESALFDLDPRAALRVCRVEARLDELFEADLAQAIEDIEAGEHAQTQVTLLFLFRELEGMGDRLLEAGEAVLSACLGESIKVDRLWALGDDLSLDDIKLDEVAETRSGATIRSLSRDGQPDAPVIVKDDRLEKVRLERAATERWRALSPELAPAVREFQELGDRGAIVYEYLPGQTLEALLLEADEVEVHVGLGRLSETLHWIWRETREDAPCQAGFVAQTRSRLEAVHAVHPDFRRPAQTIGALACPSFDELLERLELRERGLSAPFSVLIHGDLNLDNVLYQREADRVHFLDLHRSRPGDYVQDVSVFLVSPLRLRILSPSLRLRLSGAAQRFFNSAREFAREEGDATFEARLAFGLARSFVTSTRFLLAADLARELFHRARYLLERLEACADFETFRLPEDVLCD